MIVDQKIIMLSKLLAVPVTVCRSLGVYNSQKNCDSKQIRTSSLTLYLWHLYNISIEKEALARTETDNALIGEKSEYYYIRVLSD